MTTIKVEDKIRLLLLGEIISSGLSINKISRDTGLNLGTLSRFKNGKMGLNTSTAAVLLDYFGYEVKKKRLSG